MNTIERVRRMSAADLAALGLHGVAYVKPVEVDGQPAFAIHAANGLVLGVMATRAAAFAAIRDGELEPVPLQ